MTQFRNRNEKPLLNLYFENTAVNARQQIDGSKFLRTVTLFVNHSGVKILLYEILHKRYPEKLCNFGIVYAVRSVLRKDKKEQPRERVISPNSDVHS